ncbi:mannose-1-phosphate guanylyltransferase [Cellulomonas carbonis]|uniref:Mannose-1-phosphate guanylyltransferase n=1 Tax=Cellulomonas carbonis T26 TaxID=947969 RepID=A0A0A0BMJ5_9CELL|nr:mannose-1-phosphate guanylyltransferase [Cellulomonas carbonis]KGM09176.1 mannose-1-phosphate guanylyltransferase [Cellulomonas carbonis T26]GGC15055.1 mannose-1-phosphate guanyltransferase [Cellulomonas carbonis]
MTESAESSAGSSAGSSVPPRSSAAPAARVPGLHAVVPAGGAGTRLWPLSRAGSPKFLHDLTGAGRSLLQQTVDRLAPLADGVVVVTGERHAAAVLDQLPDLRGSVLAEPSPRDSMAAIGLAAAVLAEREDDPVIGSFAADQVVEAGPAFGEAVRQAVVAARAGYVVTVGIRASGPSTAFGYVRTGEPLGLADAPDACRASGFTEKPDAATAAAYLATGEYRWNAGMFVVRASVLLDHLARLLPVLHDGLREIARAWDTDARDDVLARVWPGLQRIAIDHAIAEPVAAEGGVAVVPGDFGWDDVGDFASLGDLVPADAEGRHVLGDADAVLTLDAARPVVVPGSGRLVAVLGLDDAVVVDMPDALLVTTRAHAQQVKGVVDAVRAAGRDDLV